jgi:hypothetical protein
MGFEYLQDVLTTMATGRRRPGVETPAARLPRAEAFTQDPKASGSFVSTVIRPLAKLLLNPKHDVRVLLEFRQLVTEGLSAPHNTLTESQRQAVSAVDQLAKTLYKNPENLGSALLAFRDAVSKHPAEFRARDGNGALRKDYMTSAARYLDALIRIFDGRDKKGNKDWRGREIAEATLNAVDPDRPFQQRSPADLWAAKAGMSSSLCIALRSVSDICRESAMSRWAQRIRPRAKSFPAAWSQ